MNVEFLQLEVALFGEFILEKLYHAATLLLRCACAVVHAKHQRAILIKLLVVVLQVQLYPA